MVNLMRLVMDKESIFRVVPYFLVFYDTTLFLPELPFILST